MESNIKKKIKSFVLRSGKLTAGQKNAMENYSGNYCLDFTGQELNFSEIFANDNPVIMDIGFGMGHALCAQALENEGFNFIGVEVYPAGVGALIASLSKHNVKNVKIIQYDAVEILSSMVAPHSLAKIQLLYPDPWPKKRHHKRRIVSQEFLNLCAKSLEKDGLLQVVTDWEPYAEHILNQIEQNMCFNIATANAENLPWPDVNITSFAKKAILKKHVINNIVAKLIKS